MLIPLRSFELQKLIPSVATSNQFSEALGNPRKILQRIIISSIGGVITLLISQSQVSSQFYSLWLILGVIFLRIKSHLCGDGLKDIGNGREVTKNENLELPKGTKLKGL